MADRAFCCVGNLVVARMKRQAGFGEQLRQHVLFDGPKVAVRVEAALCVYEPFPLVDDSMRDKGRHVREHFGDEGLVVGVRPFPEALLDVWGELRTKARQLRVLVAKKTRER